MELSTGRKKYLSELAEFVANEYCVSNVIQPNIIAEANSISYSFGNYEDAFDGLIEHESGHFHIFLNMDKLQHAYTPRARFTFAHELGHYYIDEHRNALKSGRVPSHPSYTNFSSNNYVEREADFFAACLLMPEDRFKKDCFGKKFTYTLIDELSKKYQASITATLLRFIAIGTHPIMVICAANDKVKWLWRSHDFPLTYLNTPLGHISSSTVAGEYFQKKTKYETEEPVFGEDWFIVQNKIDRSRQFFEKCIYSDSINQVLSVIWEK